MFAQDIKNAIVPSPWLLSRMLSGQSNIPDKNIASIRDGLMTAEHVLADFIEFASLLAKEFKPALAPFIVCLASKRAPDWVCQLPRQS
jgi:hypothetical protein